MKLFDLPGIGPDFVHNFWLLIFFAKDQNTTDVAKYRPNTYLMSLYKQKHHYFLRFPSMISSCCYHQTVVADDTIVFKVIKYLMDCIELQTLLYCFSEWYFRNFICLSIDKGNIMLFHRKCLPIVFDFVISCTSAPRTTR